MKKICLDAGHYGKYNQSPVNKAYYESDMSWKLHKYLKSELEAYGFQVTVTRTSQSADLALEERGKKSKGCDLFLSLHSNACNSQSTDHPLACCCISGKADKLGQQLADIVAKTMGTVQQGKILKKTGDSGDWYGVLRGAASVGVPGILMEHSFHTNAKATAWLLSDANLKKLAAAEAKVIADYFGMKKTAEKSNTQNTQTATTSAFKAYKVKVVCDALNIRKTPKWTSSDVVGKVKKNEVYTIVGETTLDGTKFGKLKSGAGWISLGSKYVKKM